MAINATVVRTSSGSWQFTWAAGSPPYAIWLDGILIASGLSVLTYEYVLHEYEDDAPPLEILNDGDSSENQAYPPRFTLQWRGLQNATAYVIQEFVDAAWVDVATVDEFGFGYYSWTTLALEDGVVHARRVLAVDVVDNEGTPIAFSSVITRNPAPPDVAFSVAGGDIVISAA